LCRVIKKNEKSKRAETSSNDVTSQTSYQTNDSGSQNMAPIAEFNNVSIETNPSNFWISPDMILDSSKVLFYFINYYHRNQLGKLILNSL
jgi:hypothetical protein